MWYYVYTDAVPKAYPSVSHLQVSFAPDSPVEGCTAPCSPDLGSCEKLHMVGRGRSPGTYWAHLLRRCYVEALNVTMSLDVTGHHCGQADLVVAAFNKSLKLVADKFTCPALTKLYLEREPQARSMQAFSRKSNLKINNKLLFISGHETLHFMRASKERTCWTCSSLQRLTSIQLLGTSSPPDSADLLGAETIHFSSCLLQPWPLPNSRGSWNHSTSSSKTADSVTIELRIAVFQLKGIASVQHHLRHCGLILLVALFASAVLHQSDEAPHGDHQGAGDA